MGFGTLVAVVVVVFVVLAIIAGVKESKKVAAMTPPERQSYLANKAAISLASTLTAAHGQLKPMMLCPHCQEKGQVRTQPVKRKKGLSGGKATAALLTGGLSLLATGLSRKELTTEAFCGNCTNSWDF
jgi:hypothetical protein